MCGIVGFIGNQEDNLAMKLVVSLSALEYRGYDSAGVGVLSKNRFSVTKAVGGLTNLKDRLSSKLSASTAGLAHTRWATHGAPTERNALPIMSPDGKAIIVFNGIVENDIELRRELSARGARFTTDNDAETFLLWILSHFNGDISDAIRLSLPNVKGRYAFAIIHLDQPDLLVAAKKGSPLSIGKSPKGMYVTSDPIAIQEQVSQIHYLDDGMIANISKDKVTVISPDGRKNTNISYQNFRKVTATVLQKEFDSYTLQEIYSQPETLAQGINAAAYLREQLSGMSKVTDRVVFVGCGTAYHACLIGELWLEQNAKIPAKAVTASEFRISTPHLDKKTLVIAISQSGETADTLACLELAKQRGAKTLALCNAPTSTMARSADKFIPICCGTEIGVASTKAYSGMLLQLAFFTLAFAIDKGAQEAAMWNEYSDAAIKLPGLASEIIQGCREQVKQMTRTLREKRHFFFMGRHVFLPTAYEGALKLKELSYRHAEGIGAGDLKHGTLALIETQYPVIAIAPRSSHNGKVIGNIREASTRGAQIWGIITAGDRDMQSVCHSFIEVPEVLPLFAPIVAVLPLQLLAYEFAKTLGRNVDRPRNLAKSVTVD